MRDDLKRMAEVTEALYLREYGKIASILELEARLRQQIRQIDEQIGAANDALREGVLTMQGMGAEILWQSWAGRNKARLEAELRAVEHRKRLATDDVRRAHGRQQAVEAMQAGAERARLDARLQSQHRRLLDM